MTSVTDELIEEMTQAIVRAVNPERVILFGSRARESADPDSDIDLLIVETEPFGPGRSRRMRIASVRRALAPFRVPKDILVYSSHEVAKWQSSLNHIISHALKEGKILYARS